jgi:hypothetical protein
MDLPEVTHGHFWSITTLTEDLFERLKLNMAIPSPSCIRSVSNPLPHRLHTEFAMESARDTKTPLQAIHHPSDVQLLDDIDKLRSHGISHLVALPQLVVCGDQSSGKSSVLEAIFGIPFPTKDNLCTRFATEVVLTRTSDEQVSVTITPGPGREQNGAQKLQQFNMTLTDLKVFGEVLEEAKTAMGVVEGGSAFTDDVLRIDISGPDRPHLTIVDLPGLIHSHNKL